MATSKMKDRVRQGYDNMAPTYLEWTLSGSSSRLQYLEKFLANLSSKTAEVLELGCGAGTPVTEALIKHESIAHVTANDISAKQIQLARERLSDAIKGGKVDFVEGDMTALSFDDQTLDGVLAFFSIFHLPRDEQAPFLRKINNWLKLGGVLLVNFATQDAAEIRGDFCGADMFWSGYGVEGSKGMVQQAGFELIDAEVAGSSDEELGEDDPDHGIEFLWVVARKKGA